MLLLKFLLFIAFVPGVLLTIPSKQIVTIGQADMKVVLVHAVLFTAASYFLWKVLGKSK